MKKLFSIFFILLVFLQGLWILSIDNTNQSGKYGKVLINQTNELNEVYPNILKTTKRVAERITEYNISNDIASDELSKGNSSFYIHNQLIPKALALHKIQSAFFTAYFSTAV